MIRTVLDRWKTLLPATRSLALGMAFLPFAAPVFAPIDADRVADLAQSEAVEAPTEVVEVAPAPPAGMSPSAWDAALAAWESARAEGAVANPKLTVIDYSLPDTEERLWVVDMETQQVLFHELVAHGKNSGDAVPTDFSNEVDSLKTSLGVFKTAETYHGSRGYSLKLDGLEPGVNDNARERGIVIHGSDYVNEERARDLGRIGRSWGCPAVDREVHESLIDTIKGGSLVVSYAPDTDWLGDSRYVASR